MRKATSAAPTPSKLRRSNLRRRVARDPRIAEVARTVEQYYRRDDGLRDAVRLLVEELVTEPRRRPRDAMDVVRDRYKIPYRQPLALAYSHLLDKGVIEYDREEGRTLHWRPPK